MIEMKELDYIREQIEKVGKVASVEVEVVK